MILIKNKVRGKAIAVTDEGWAMMKKKGKDKLFEVVGTTHDRPVKPLTPRTPTVPEVITRVKQKGNDAPKADK